VSRPLDRRGALRLLAGGSLAAMAVAHAPFAFAQDRAALYKDPNAPIPARVADLMARMTLAGRSPRSAPPGRPRAT
jgi:beta-glucosidase